MKKLLLVLFVSIQIGNAFAQSPAVEKKPVQISWITPISTNKISDSIIYNSSLNILAGFNHGIYGAELGGLVNITRTDASFVQIAGLTNLVGQKSTGLQMAGLANRSETINGVQLSGLINSTNTANGIQLAGLVNQANEINGLQLSGLVNYAKKVNGLQLGFINIADTIERGASIGFISIVKSGIHQFEISFNDVTAVNLSFRSGSNTFYGIFTAGIQAKHEPLWTAGLGFGTRFNVKEDKIIGSIEATGSSVNRTEGNIDQDLNLLNKLSFIVGYKVNRFLINAGPVLNVYVTQKQNKESGAHGFNIDKNNFFDKTSGKTNTRMWIGYQIGVWF
ncbi:MAG: hypothetical protein ACJA08_001206 [Cyclobacteriaceae bacterium]|jgi:hypothetical protein